VGKKPDRCGVRAGIGLVLTYEHAKKLGIVEGLNDDQQRYVESMVDAGFSDQEAAEIVVGISMFPDMAIDLGKKSREIWERKITEDEDAL